MNTKINELDNFKIDVLREVGNIGAGHAASALAVMLQKRVDMDVPEIKILDFSQINEIMGAETLAAGILLNVSGDMDATMILLLEIKSAEKLINMVMGRPADQECEMKSMELSAMKEIGNILAGSYVQALTVLTGMNLKLSIPDIAVDMAGAILSVPAIELGKVADQVLYIETQFSEGSSMVRGNFFLIPEVDSYDKLLKSLGVNT